jgi:iron complex outermembrane receptor protein
LVFQCGKTTTASIINVVLSEEGGQALQEIVVTGSRTPVEVIPKSFTNRRSIKGSSFYRTNYSTKLYNTEYLHLYVQTPVNDATSLDPYEIRNMGPSRTLILINGKRKNLSALLYTQTSPGETGSDISEFQLMQLKTYKF